jgi:hypothetical protein
MASIDG